MHNLTLSAESVPLSMTKNRWQTREQNNENTLQRRSSFGTESLSAQYFWEWRLVQTEGNTLPYFVV